MPEWLRLIFTERHSGKTQARSAHATFVLSVLPILLPIGCEVNESAMRWHRQERNNNPGSNECTRRGVSIPAMQLLVIREGYG
jgi:hypothetical protein